MTLQHRCSDSGSPAGTEGECVGEFDASESSEISFTIKLKQDNEMIYDKVSTYEIQAMQNLGEQIKITATKEILIHSVNDT